VLVRLTKFALTSPCKSIELPAQSGLWKQVEGMPDKRYYWLKLKEDFFDEKYIKALRKLPQGDSQVIVYLKMQLKSLKTEGIINYEGILPDCISELALALDEDENVVRLTVEALIRFGVVERLENDTLYMLAMQQLIGSETQTAARVRKHRENIALQCNATVTKCNTEKEIREKRVEKDTPPTPSKGAGGAKKQTAKPQPEKIQFAEFVSMTNDEYTSLVAKVGEQGAKRCIEILDNYKGSSGKTYKSDYRTMLNWVIARYEEELRKGGKSNGNDGSKDVGTADTEHSKYAIEF
ncbi:MAG: phage replisome organizer N-terminal domain-containing protein, partial [Oscillospiraceae bacterium]|nr:phage replisome organizer N-terminal domain-containing protein [Oscillospiraceae bacterium]